MEGEVHDDDEDGADGDEAELDIDEMEGGVQPEDDVLGRGIRRHTRRSTPSESTSYAEGEDYSPDGQARDLFHEGGEEAYQEAAWGQGAGGPDQSRRCAADDDGGDGGSSQTGANRVRPEDPSDLLIPGHDGGTGLQRPPSMAAEEQVEGGQGHARGASQPSPFGAVWVLVAAAVAFNAAGDRSCSTTDTTTDNINDNRAHTKGLGEKIELEGPEC